MKNIVVIGGGTAGLSAGIFAQKNGFNSIIVEKKSDHRIEAIIRDIDGSENGGPNNVFSKRTGKNSTAYFLYPQINRLILPRLIDQCTRLLSKKCWLAKKVVPNNCANRYRYLYYNQK